MTDNSHGISVELTFFRTADELYSIEAVDATRLKDGEALQGHATVFTRLQWGLVPILVVLALLWIMDVIKDAVLRDKESITLELSNWNGERQRESLL